MNHLNIEIKARCADPERVREILKAVGAEFKGTDHQIDTYFNVSRGRLKLREGNIENYLIFYKRENQAGPKQSDVTLLDTAPQSPLKEILALSLGILVVVDKKREIYFIDNVKFHIDDVAGLGWFIEIEAIDSDSTISSDRLFGQCSAYMDRLGILDKDLVSDSYSTLLLGLHAGMSI